LIKGLKQSKGGHVDEWKKDGKSRVMSGKPDRGRIDSKKQLTRSCVGKKGDRTTKIGETQQERRTGRGIGETQNQCHEA